MLEGLITCLALNIYHEARGEPIEGQIAVALTTLNRARVSDCGICGSVFQGGQFSWTRKWNGRIPEGKEWKQAQMAAHTSLRLKDYTGGATHYHAVSISPFWASSKELLGQWGNHLFYRSEEIPRCKGNPATGVGAAATQSTPK